jgi:hypothetical protein
MTIQFRLQAQAEAQCLPRLLDHFAQRGLIPSSIVADQIGHRLEILIEHPTIEEAAAELICERLRRIASVQHVSTSRLRVP